MTMKPSCLLLLAVASLLSSQQPAMAFLPLPNLQTTTTITTSHNKMVKYDGDKWIATSAEEQEGYGIAGTLLRQGPIPALRRIFDSDNYEQAVLKFMAGENCDRNTAQGNMDAYFRNPNDWLAIRMNDEKDPSGEKFDFVTVKPRKAIFFYLWSTIVIAVAGNGLLNIARGDLDMVQLLFGNSHQFDFLLNK